MPDQDILVTVAIPVHNGARFLGAALDSALGQSHRELEVLLYDDGSTDDSVAVAHAFADDRLRVMHGPRNAGVGAARQVLKNEARGEYVVWLDADDVFEPQRVAVLLRTARETGADIVTDASGFMAESGAPLPGEKRVPDRVAVDPCFTRLFERNTMNPHPLVSRACLAALDFDPELTVSEDYDFWLKASWRGCRFARVEAVLHRYRLVADSLSSNPVAQRSALRRILARYPVDGLEQLYRERGFSEGHVQYMACLQHLFRGQYVAARAYATMPWPDENDADQEFYRGTLALKCGDDAAAESFLQRHLERWPDSPAGLNNLGVCQRRRGVAVGDVWAKALALFPGYQDAAANRAGREAVTLTQLAPRRHR